jgi:putative methionine-R-sulfoxide reductase with GAF domain
MDRITFLSKRVKDLEGVIGQKNKEIAKLESINRYLLLGQQTRDEIIASALAENHKIKDSLQWFQAHGKQPGEPTLERSLTKHPRADSRKRLLKSGTMREKPIMFHDEKAKSKLFNDLMEDEDNFIERFAGLESQLQRDLMRYIRHEHGDYKNLVEISLRLKRLLTATHKVSLSLALGDVVDRLILETCTNLGCDRASVFLIDETNNELWSRGAKGTDQIIRIALTKGFVGYVATTGKGVNIENAYNDKRFDCSFDTKTNYKTRTVLAAPIRDPTGKIIGVCQAINKEDGVFNTDDEAFFEMLISSAGVIIKHSLETESSQLSQHRMQLLVNVIVQLLPATSLRELELIACKGATVLLSSSQAVMYRVQGANLVHYNDSGDIEEKPMSGLIGDCVSTGLMIAVPDAYADPRFNMQTDMDTSMPIIVIPVKDSLGSVVAAVQIVNSRGVLGRLMSQKVKMDALDLQILENYGRALGAVMERLFPGG